MLKLIVFVIGCNGFIGLVIVKVLLDNYLDKVNIIVGIRDLVLEKVVKLKILLGVIVVRVDMIDKEVLGEQLCGVILLFIVILISGIKIVIGVVEVVKFLGVKYIFIVSVFIVSLIDIIYGKQYIELELSVQNLDMLYIIICFFFFVDNYWGF